jgi:protein-tyrosine-phosphatase
MADKWWSRWGIAGLGLGYFLWYVPYCALTKALSSGTLRGLGPVPGLVLLPAVALGTLAAVPVFLLLTGWGRYARRRRVLGLDLPVPGRETLASGFWTALIIGTTTLNFTFAGVSILLMLLLMRSGVLILSPIVDKVRQKTVQRASWAAFALSFLAGVVALADVRSYTMTLAAGLSLGAYLAGYIGRFEIMSRHAKLGDEAGDRRFFVEENIAAALILVALLAVPALLGGSAAAFALRQGFTSFLTTRAALPAFAVGVLYEGLFICGTLIYLDRREYTYCVPVNRCSSLLAGVASSYLLAALFGLAVPSSGLLAASGIVVAALLVLSWPVLAAGARRAGARMQPPAAARLFVFVCSGNTCRSPMAAAVARAEIAASRGRAGWTALSAGLTPRLGEPMTAEAGVALRELGVPAGEHRASALTPELIARAEMVFCMTQKLRGAVLALAGDLAAAGKIVCLDPEGDIPDPIGSALPVYTSCAERIREMVRLRFGALEGAV